MTMIRMFAMAMGGASDLSPITKGGGIRGSGKPNWHIIQNLYATAGAFGIILGLLTGITAFALGAFALENLTQDYPNSADIWTAFVVMIVGQSIPVFFIKYQIALKGMNYVALTNRWNALFSLLSTGAAFAVLILGGSIIALAIVVQFFLLVGILRFYFMLNFVVEPKFREMPSVGYSSQVARWCWTPLWRGIGVSFSNRGALQLSSIVFARFGEPSLVASFMVSLKIIEGLKQVSGAPLDSHIPRLSRMLAEGNIVGLRKNFQGKTRLAQSIFVAGALVLGACGGYVFFIIGSNADFLDPVLFLGLALAMMLHLYLNQTLLISMIGNNVICFEREFAAACLSVALSIVLIPRYEILGLLIAIILPRLTMLHLVPLRIGVEMLETTTMRYLQKTIAIPAAFFIFGAIIVAMFVSS